MLSISKVAKSRKAIAVGCAVAVATMAAGIAQASAATPAQYNASACYSMTSKPFIHQGSVGNCVALLQWDLTQEGYPTSIDGKFGPMTRANLIKYQTRENLTVDGNAGSMTWMKLADNPAPPVTTAKSGMGVDYMRCLTVLPKTLVKVGSSGDCVAVLQWDLGKEGYPTTIDGKFGPMTKANVIKYQIREGLMVDGIVGPQTWGKLADNNVIEPPAPTPTTMAPTPTTVAPTATTAPPAKVTATTLPPVTVPKLTTTTTICCMKATTTTVKPTTTTVKPTTTTSTTVKPTTTTVKPTTTTVKPTTTSTTTVTTTPEVVPAKGQKF